MHFVNIGFDTYLDFSDVESIIDARRNFAKKFSKEARERGVLVDCSQGRKWGSLLILKSGKLYTSIAKPATILERAKAGGTSRGIVDIGEDDLPAPGPKRTPEELWEKKGEELLKELENAPQITVPEVPESAQQPLADETKAPEGPTLLDAMRGDNRYE